MASGTDRVRTAWEDGPCVGTGIQEKYRTSSLDRVAGRCFSAVMASPMLVCSMPISSDRKSLEMEGLLRRFPKIRPPLPEEYRKRYVSDYRENRQGRVGVARLVATLEAWMHRTIASIPGSRVLELGAGTLNHIPFEPLVDQYDVIEPFHALWVDSPHRAKVTHFYDDVINVPLTARYDKLISVAVVEHLTALPDIIVQCARRLSNGGSFSAGLPSEGGLAWYCAWRLGTGTVYRLRTGLSYEPIMRHEHVNTAKEIEATVRLFFGDIERRRFPLPFLHTSFYTVLTARNPDLCACDQWEHARSRQGF